MGAPTDMNQVLAVIKTNEWFEKYCRKCIRLRDCRPGTDEKRRNDLKKETLEDWKNKLTQEDIERDFQRCFESE
jgi:hypothetical protein